MDNDTNIAPRILIAVDDPDLRRTSVAGLRAAGFSVSAPTDGEAAIMLAESFSPDVLIVCSHLRAPDGRPLYERLRESSEQYLLCITDEGAHRARAAVLHSGADDAVSMPVLPEELSARCHALLRRPRQMQSRVDSPLTSVLNLGPLTIDLGRREVRIVDEEVATTRIEFSLLEQLCRRPTEVCTAKTSSTPCGARRGSATTTSSTSICRTCAASSTRPARRTRSSTPCVAWVSDWRTT